MQSDQLEEENRRLLERERLDIAPTGMLRLFIVGRLARRRRLTSNSCRQRGRHHREGHHPPGLFPPGRPGCLRWSPDRQAMRLGQSGPRQSHGAANGKAPPAVGRRVSWFVPRAPGESAGRVCTPRRSARSPALRRGNLPVPDKCRCRRRMTRRRIHSGGPARSDPPSGARDCRPPLAARGCDGAGQPIAEGGAPHRRSGCGERRSMLPRGRRPATNPDPSRAESHRNQRVGSPAPCPWRNEEIQR